MKHTFPTGYGEDCIVIEIDKALLPLVSGALRPFEQRYSWVSDEDYEQGYNAFAQLQAAMAGKCIQALIDSNDRIYRLLDMALNGNAYISTPNPEDPTRPIILPEIPATPQIQTTHFLAMRAQLARIHQLLENAATGATYSSDSGIDGTVALDYAGSWRARLEAVQGNINAGWFGIGGQPATFANIVEALRIGKPQDAERIDTALELLTAASSTANIFDIVRNLLTETVDVGLEGATLGTLIAASIANAATQGILAGKIDRIISALDGGGLVAPTTNVIERLTNIDANLEP